MTVSVKTFAQYIRDVLPFKCRVEVHGNRILIYRPNTKRVVMNYNAKPPIKHIQEYSNALWPNEWRCIVKRVGNYCANHAGEKCPDIEVYYSTNCFGLSPKLIYPIYVANQHT